MGKKDVKVEIRTERAKDQWEASSSEVKPGRVSDGISVAGKSAERGPR